MGYAMKSFIQSVSSGALNSTHSLIYSIIRTLYNRRHTATGI